jgi:hypothetical protein
MATSPTLLTQASGQVTQTLTVCSEGGRAVGLERPQPGSVGARRVSQDERVEPVVLGARRPIPGQQVLQRFGLITATVAAEDESASTTTRPFSVIYGESRTDTATARGRRFIGCMRVGKDADG